MKRKPSVLVAEDEDQARTALEALLTDEGYTVQCAADGNEAARLLTAGGVEGALIDIRMPGRDGLSVLRGLREMEHPPAVLIMTAYGSSGAAIEAMALGAFDYLTKPLNFDEVLIQLERAIENRRRIRELEGYRSEASAAEAEMVGSSPPMQALYKLIGQVAPTDSTVLIRGESGTGKELVAQAIHRHSTRAERRLVTVNCASIPETLLEAELFGHERGAFTGATQQRVGKFEFADGGTLFLDEVGELAPATQAKLLRVIQDHWIERLGSNRIIPLDVRLLAATNRDLEEMVKTGGFREDLYYRLKVVTLEIPPLRQRRGDVGELAAFLLRSGAARLKLPEPTLADDTIRQLEQMDWPGNVRELEHVLERALILSRGGIIGPQELETPQIVGTPEKGFHAAVSDLERRLVEQALAEAGGNKTRAAELLKINRRLLYDKMKEFGL